MFFNFFASYAFAVEPSEIHDATLFLSTTLSSTSVLNVDCSTSNSAERNDCSHCIPRLSWIHRPQDVDTKETTATRYGVLFS